MKRIILLILVLILISCKNSQINNTIKIAFDNNDGIIRLLNDTILSSSRFRKYFNNPEFITCFQKSLNYYKNDNLVILSKTEKLVQMDITKEIVKGLEISIGCKNCGIENIVVKQIIFVFYNIGDNWLLEAIYFNERPGFDF